MLSRLLAGSPLPADQQSVVPTVRGLPWWGAVVLAVALTSVAAWLAPDDGVLGRVFKVGLLLGVVAAALAVRRRALFTAAVQPPLIAFIIGLISLFTRHNGTGDKKTFILKVVLPIAELFPWMVVTFIITLAVVLARLLLTGPESARLFGGIPGIRRRLSGSKKASTPKKTRPAKKSRPATKTRPAEKSRPAETTTTAAPRPRPDSTRRRAAAAAAKTPPKRRPARPAPERAPQAAEAPRRRTPRPQPAPEAPRARPQKIPASQRRTAGQQLRDRGQVEDLAAGLDD